jgi:DNA-nicking Smr family endonuclease
MSGRRGLSDDERAVWDIVTRKIKPLKRARNALKIEASEPVAEPASRKRAPAKAAVVAPPAAPKAAPKPQPPALSPLTRREKQRVARGHDRIDARLDLHGHTQDEAHGALLRFLRAASAHEKKLVLVITGKSGVLRRQVPLWLSTAELRPLVISTDIAAINHGGEGALYIRVRRGRG